MMETEAKSQTAHELVSVDLESQFAMLESGSDVDDELAAMKAQLAGIPYPQGALPDSEEGKTAPSDATVDAELEALRKQIDNL